MVGVRDADTGDVCPRVAAYFGNDVAAVAGAALSVVEPYDIGELDNRSRVLHACGVDELNTVRGGHVPLKPHERRRRSPADGVVQQQDPTRTSCTSCVRSAQCGKRAIQGYAYGEFLASAPFGETADVFGSRGSVVAGFENLDGEAARPRCFVNGGFEERHAFGSEAFLDDPVDDPFGVDDQICVVGPVKADPQDLPASPRP